MLLPGPALLAAKVMALVDDLILLLIAIAGAGAGLVFWLARGRGVQRRRRLLPLLGLLLLVFAASGETRYSSPRRGSELAGSAFPTLQPIAWVGASEARLAPPEEGYLVVNFWATWCRPCLEEMPLLERYWSRYGPRGVRFVGVTRLYESKPGSPEMAGELEKIGEVLASRGVTYPSAVVEAKDLDRQLPASGLPTTLLVSSRGRILEAGTGNDGTRRVLWRTALLSRRGPRVRAASESRLLILHSRISR